MARKSSKCLVEVEVNKSGMEQTFLSSEMYELLSRKAAQVAKEKTGSATRYLKGSMPTSGLFGYHMRLGKHTWIAVVRPNNRAAAAIGAKHKTKKL